MKNNESKTKKYLLACLVLLCILFASNTAEGTYPLPTSQIYTYENMVRDIEVLKEDYPAIIKVTTVGNSVENVPLHMLALGKGPRKILVVGSLHAREWINTALLMEMVKTYAKDYYAGTKISGEPVKHVLNTHTFHVVPLANPDGVKLQQFGANAFPAKKQSLIKMNKGSGNFTRWKANIRGVDLNRNWNVQWNTPKSGSINTTPSSEFYRGGSPESEPEVKAIANWVRANNPIMLLDFHSSGEDLFWYYYQTGNILERDRKIAGALGQYTGYRVEAVNKNKPANTTITRWSVMVIKMPSVCIENGVSTNTFQTMNNFNYIIKKIRYAIPVAAINMGGYAKYVAVSAVSLDKKEIQMAVGDTLHLVAKIAPDNASDKSVIWYSGNEGVAEVDNRGKITVKDVGSTTVNVETVCGGKKATCTVNVPYVAPEAIRLDHHEYTLYLNGVKNRITLHATISPPNTSYRDVTWMTSDGDVLSVKNGRVEALSEGTGTITVRTVDGGLTDSCIFAVVNDGIMYGDVNDDGVIDVNDAIMILRYAVGLIEEIDLIKADVTGNGAVDVMDAIKVLRYIVGL